jgi:hypothetical protein
LDIAGIVKENSDFTIRTEFSFTACDSALASILADIAEESVNIAGYYTNRTLRNENFVRLVPGSAESENNRELRVVRRTLQAHKIPFKEQNIITVSPDRIQTGVPEGYSRLFDSLRCKVKVNSFYLRERFCLFKCSECKKGTRNFDADNS